MHFFIFSKAIVHQSLQIKLTLAVSYVRGAAIDEKFYINFLQYDAKPKKDFNCVFEIGTANFDITSIFDYSGYILPL